VPLASNLQQVHRSVPRRVCCSDFDETLDLPRQCLLGRRRSFVTGMQNSSKCYRPIQGPLFSCSACPVWGARGTTCPWPHTVCLVYGRNRPDRCSARPQVPPVCRRLPNLRRHVSKCSSQFHRPAFALSLRRLDECEPTTPA